MTVVLQFDELRSARPVSAVKRAGTESVPERATARSTGGRGSPPVTSIGASRSDILGHHFAARRNFCDRSVSGGRRVMADARRASRPRLAVS